MNVEQKIDLILQKFDELLNALQEMAEEEEDEFIDQ